MKQISYDEMAQAIQDEYARDKAKEQQSRKITDADIRDVKVAMQAVKDGRIVVDDIPAKATVRPVDEKGQPIRRPNGVVAVIRHNYTNYQDIMDDVNVQAAPEVANRYDDRQRKVIPMRMTRSMRASMKMGSKFAQLYLHREIGMMIVKKMRDSGNPIYI
jgi:hypothetical protein